MTPARLALLLPLSILSTTAAASPIHILLEGSGADGSVDGTGFTGAAWRMEVDVDDEAADWSAADYQGVFSYTAARIEIDGVLYELGGVSATGEVYLRDWSEQAGGGAGDTLQIAPTGGSNSGITVDDDGFYPALFTDNNDLSTANLGASADATTTTGNASGAGGSLNFAALDCPALGFPVNDPICIMFYDINYNPLEGASGEVIGISTSSGVGPDWAVSVAAISAFAPDADEDGVPDDIDNCPAVANADQADVDGDGVADACDVCPSDFFNDSDGDGSCDSDDPCALDADDDADADGVCGDLDLCPLDPDDDWDVDGICGDVDVCPFDSANDADGDGVCGNEETCPGGDDNLDADLDTVADYCDVCPLDDGNDADGDGICGDIDICPFDPADDADGDGTCADEDICPLDADNDLDGDGVCGDVDPCPLDIENDADGDGVCEIDDNCSLVANGSQSDVDGDTIGDACDTDNDGDGIDDSTDNCPLDWNPTQGDADGDLVGDACDTDIDGDDILDIDDTCLDTTPGDVVLDNGCSVDQACPCDGDWKNHGAYEKCVSGTLKDLRKDDLISGSEARTLRDAADDNTCGQTGRGKGHHTGDKHHNFEDQSGHECHDHGHGHGRGKGHKRGR